MQVDIPNNGKDFFDCNKSLLLVKAFEPFITESYIMIFVALVADCQSPFYKQDDEKRRELACLCTPKLHRGDNVNEFGQKLIKRQNKKVEDAIKYYSENINPKKKQMVVTMLDSLYSQWESVCSVLNFGSSAYEKDEDGKFKKDSKGNKIKINADELLKIQDQCNKITKDGLDRKIWSSIEFYEEQLSFVYKPKETIAKHITTDVIEDGIGDLADKIDTF